MILSDLLNRPALSVIYSNSYKTEAVVSELPGSSVAESFRNLQKQFIPEIQVRTTESNNDHLIAATGWKKLYFV